MSHPPQHLPANAPRKATVGAVTTKDGKVIGNPASYGSHHRAFAADNRTYYDTHDTNLSLRHQFTRDDYEFFRPGEAIPDKATDIIRDCRNMYRRVGIIRNVMDLMSDFGCQGAKLVHPNPTIQKFYRAWWKRVNGAHVSERFLNLLYREAVAIIKRTTGKLSKPNQRKMVAIGTRLEPDGILEEPLTTSNRNIPLRYNFLNPLTLVALAPELSQFVGQQTYAIKVSYRLRQAVQRPKTQIERQLVDMLPEDIRAAIKRGDSTIPLDRHKLIVAHYKKDDWQTWADPMTYAIMDDVMLLEKMKLADLAALDGAITQVRLWTLGSVEHELFPTDEGIDRLHDVLISNPGGGAFDIIWGPELSVNEYKTNVHEFLGKEKYEPVWNAIYEGLGVPPTLTGAINSAGYTNNYISLKTLVQRLEYGRAALRSFWEQEIELVRQAMGFKTGAKIVFDNMVLSDEAAEKALLIQLVDRDILSLDTVIERFGELPEFETLKLEREEKARTKGKMRPKASAWHTPEKTYNLMKLALQRGYVSPEQAGLADDIPEEFLDMETPWDQQMKKATGPPSDSKSYDDPNSGRPKGAKDKKPRDKRTPKPTGANTAAYLTALMWAKDAQSTIAEVLNPLLLKHYGKKSARALSAKQIEQVEAAKFDVLCRMKPYQKVDAAEIRICLNSKTKNAAYRKVYDELHRSFLQRKGGNATIDDIRMLQACAYAALNADEETILNHEDE